MVEQLELISESLYTVVLVPCGYEHRGDLGGGLWPPIHALHGASAQPICAAADLPAAGPVPNVMLQSSTS